MIYLVNDTAFNTLVPKTDTAIIQTRPPLGLKTMLKTLYLKCTQVQLPLKSAALTKELQYIK